MAGFGPPSDRMDVDHGQLVGRCLDDVAVVVHCDEFAEVGGRPAARREGFTPVREDFPEAVEQLVEREADDALGVGRGGVARSRRERSW